MAIEGQRTPVQDSIRLQRRHPAAHDAAPDQQPACACDHVGFDVRTRKQPHVTFQEYPAMNNVDDGHLVTGAKTDA